MKRAKFYSTNRDHAKYHTTAAVSTVCPIV